MVSAIRDLYVNESEALAQDSPYHQRLKNEYDAAYTAFNNLIKDNPEMRAAFIKYSDSRTSLEADESQAMFFAGYVAALKAAGEGDLGTKIYYSSYEMYGGEAEAEEATA